MKMQFSSHSSFSSNEGCKRLVRSVGSIFSSRKSKFWKKRPDASKDLEIGGTRKTTDDSFFWNNSTFRAIGAISLAIFLPYVIYSGFKCGYFDQNVQDKIMVIYSMPETYFTKQQGMFAEFEAIIGALHYAETHQAYGLRVNFIDQTFYTREEGDNWWAYFFEPNVTIRTEESTAVASQGSFEGREEVHFNRWVARFGKLGSFMQVLNGKHVDSAHPWPIRGSFDTSRANQLVSRYIRISDESLPQRVDDLISKKANTDDFLIGLHYRGTDKVVNYPYVTLSMAVWVFYIEEVKKHYNLKDDQIKILIATDTLEFIDYIEERYPGKSIYFESSSRLSLHDDRGTHKANDFTPKVKGESAVLDFLLLSRANYLIKNRSSLSDAALMYSKTLSENFTMILSANDPVYHFGPEFPQPPTVLWSE